MKQRVDSDHESRLLKKYRDRDGFLFSGHWRIRAWRSVPPTS